MFEKSVKNLKEEDIEKITKSSSLEIISLKTDKSQNEYYLFLSNRGNPDFAQDPSIPKYETEKDKCVRIKSYKEAVSKVSKYISDNELGGWNFSDRIIIKINKEGIKERIARISYNERLWDMEYNNIDIGLED